MAATAAEQLAAHFTHLRLSAIPAKHVDDVKVLVRDYLRRCRALLFPGEEDFGIVPLEAQACGSPVIAFGRGGATETVVPLEGTWRGKPSAPTGLWFDEQTVECLPEAIEVMEKKFRQFDEATLRRHALRYDGRRFAEEFFALVDRVVVRRSRAAA